MVINYNDKYEIILRESTKILPAFLINTISSEKRQKYEALILSMKKQGEKTIFYYKKTLCCEEVTRF